MARADTYSVKVVVDNVDLGIFSTMSGGAMDSEDVRHRPGGMQPEVSLGGPATQTEITVSRLEDETRGDPDTVTWLMSRVGKAQAKVIRTPLDRAGNVAGAPRTHRGALKMVSPADHDSNGSEPAMWSMTIAPVGVPA